MAKHSPDTSPAVATTCFSSCQTQLADFISSADARWADPQWRQELELWRKQAAAAVFANFQTRKVPADLDQAEALLTGLAHCGATDFAVSPESVTAAREYAAHGWPGIAAAALLVPCWQAPFLPSL